MSNLAKVYFETGSEKEPFLNLESTGLLGYTGMRFRMLLPKDDGQLFVFDFAGDHGFWMKDVEIPLDIIFIDGDYKVVHIHENATPNTTYPIYSGKESRYVVESNAFWCRENNVHVGTSVKFRGLM